MSRVGNVTTINKLCGISIPHKRSDDEMVDMRDLGSLGRKSVWVQIPF